jgi:hypothetical protein
MLQLSAGREASQGEGSVRYERHCPERTLLYQLIEEYYPVFEAQWAAEGKALPGYVQREFEDYLKCGCLEHGFYRVRCESCHEERLLALVCNSNYTSCGLTVILVLMSYK